MNIQWFPGHMAKTRRQIAETLKQIDLVVELADARLPLSSRNPDVPDIIGNKPHLLALNKRDMADDEMTRLWMEHYRREGLVAVSLCSIDGGGFSEIKSAMDRALEEKRARLSERGMTGRVPRVMVMGIPNSGKSAFINKLARRTGARTGDRPGVTKSLQWIRVAGGYELLDTPGVLWHKFEEERTALYLAFTGAIKDDILDTEELAARLCDFLCERYPGRLSERYKISTEEGEGWEKLERIARKRGCILSGGELDLRRAAAIILDEFRGGRLGRVTLDRLEG